VQRLLRDGGFTAHGLTTARVFVQLAEAITQPLFAQQSTDEVEVSFPVLHAQRARRQLCDKARDFIGKPPLRNAGVRSENRFDDLQQRLLEEDPTVCAAGGKPQPGRQRQSIAGETTVGVQQGGILHITGTLNTATVGEGDAQCALLVDQPQDIESGISAQQIHLPGRELRQRLPCAKRFHEPRRRIPFERKPIQPRFGREEGRGEHCGQQGCDRHGGNTENRDAG